MSKRKANGEGSITQLPSGKYRLREWVDVDGIRQRKSFTGSSPTAVRKAYKDYLASDNKVAIEHVKTVFQWAAHWLEVYAKPKISYGTLSNYTMYIENHINPAIGALRLDVVRPAHIAKLYGDAVNRFGKPLSWAGLRDIRTCLLGIFDTAVDNRLCPSNPATKVKLQKKDPREMAVFTESQMAHIVDYLDIHEYGPHIAFLLYTGLRIGELMALQWTDLDREKKLIHVRRTLHKTENGLDVGTTTKTGHTRCVPYDGALEKQLDKLPQRGLFVICRENGTHHTHKTYETLYKHFLRDLNQTLPEKEQIPYLSPHKCRHTFGTYMLRSGVDIRVVQALLGHSTIQTTEIYTHVNVEDLRKNIHKLKY